MQALYNDMCVGKGSLPHLNGVHGTVWWTNRRVGNGTNMFWLCNWRRPFWSRGSCFVEQVCHVICTQTFSPVALVVCRCSVNLCCCCKVAPQYQCRSRLLFNFILAKFYLIKTEFNVRLSGRFSCREWKSQLEREG